MNNNLEKLQEIFENLQKIFINFPIKESDAIFTEIFSQYNPVHDYVVNVLPYEEDPAKGKDSSGKIKKFKKKFFASVEEFKVFAISIKFKK